MRTKHIINSSKISHLQIREIVKFGVQICNHNYRKLVWYVKKDATIIIRKLKVTTFW